jgi:hypothetical protein
MQLGASLGLDTPLADVARMARAAGASVIVATSEEEIAEARQTIGFYASTPTYRPVLEDHGWANVGDTLAEHARRRRWDALAGEVTDEMLDAFAVVAASGEPGTALERHAGGIIDRVAPYAAFGTGPWAGLRG